MTAARNTLLVGLGSPYGDDQAGWRVADEIARRPRLGLAVRRAGSPARLLDWLGEADRLAICDACRGGCSPGSWHRWTWPSTELALAEFSGSHDLGLIAVLQLAERLGQLPRIVVIWGIEAAGEACSASAIGEAMSAEVAQGVQRIVESISRELNHA